LEQLALQRQMHHPSPHSSLPSSSHPSYHPNGFTRERESQLGGGAGGNGREREGGGERPKYEQEESIDGEGEEEDELLAIVSGSGERSVDDMILDATEGGGGASQTQLQQHAQFGQPSASSASTNPSPTVVKKRHYALTAGPSNLNSKGQRTCRACGMVGRYKDGKCVEKWGPGPDGPGTVCDRLVLVPLIIIEEEADE
jgi:hypothetical protein